MQIKIKSNGIKSSIIFICIFAVGSFSFSQESHFFELPKIHEIRLTFYVEHYWDSLIYFKEQYETTEVFQYSPCNINIDGTQFFYGGARLKGNSSYSDYDGKKKSFKLKLDEFVSCQDLEGITELNLNNAHKDPTFLREKLYYDFLRENNVTAPRCTYTKLYINSLYWGLYVVTEEIDKKFIKRNFASDNGNLYKGDPKSTLTWVDNNFSSYQKSYKKISNKKLNDWSDIVHLVKKLNQTPLSEESYFQMLDSVFDLNSVLKSWAVDEIFVNLDSYRFGPPHNYYLYFDNQTGKAFWIPWDGNYSFNAFSQNFTYQESIELPILYINNTSDNYTILKSILKNDIISKLYYKTLSELVVNFNSNYFNGKIDSLSDLIRDAVYNDTLKFYTTLDFENNISSLIGDQKDPGAYVPGLKMFIIDRRKYLLKYLKW